MIGFEKTYENLQFGGIAAYENSDIKVKDNRLSKSKVHSYSLGAYANVDLDIVDLRGGFIYSYLDIKTDRTITVPGLEGVASSSYNGNQYQIFAEVTKNLKVTETFNVAPYLNLANIWLDLDSATEKNSLAGLSIKGGTESVFATTLGIRGEYQLPLARQATMYMDLAWNHNSGDIDGKSINRFQNGTDFMIQGGALAQNMGVIGLGVEVELNRRSSLNIEYLGAFGSKVRDNSGSISFNYEF